MSPVERSIIAPDTMASPLGTYSQGVRVRGGDLLFIAGQVAVAKDGSTVGVDDIRAQTRQVYQNLGSVVEAAGGGYGNVVEFTIYLTDKANIGGYRDVRTEMFPQMYPDGEYPTSTLLVVDALASDDYLIEIKAVAAL